MLAVPIPSEFKRRRGRHARRSGRHQTTGLSSDLSVNKVGRGRPTSTWPSLRRPISPRYRLIRASGAILCIAVAPTQPWPRHSPLGFFLPEPKGLNHEFRNRLPLPSARRPVRDRMGRHQDRSRRQGSPSRPVDAGLDRPPVSPFRRRAAPSRGGFSFLQTNAIAAKINAP